MATQAAQMSPNELVGPFPIPGGWEIMLLIDKRQILMADPRDATLSLKQISLEFPKGLSEEEANRQLENFSSAVKGIRGCGDADNVAAVLKANVVANEIPARSLPEQLQSILLNMQVGEATPPFGSLQDGVRVLMLCGRDDPPSAAGLDFEAVMQQKEDERIGKRAQRYLRDLRNDAYIEYN